MGKAPRIGVKQLGLTEGQLHTAIRANRIPEPPRVGGGRSFVWSDKLIEKARLVFGKNTQAAETQHREQAAF